MILLFVHIVHADLLFTRLDDVLSCRQLVERRPSRVLPRLGGTTDTSGDESDAGESRRRLRSKKTYKMKKSWGTSDVGRFFVTAPTDVAKKPSHFFAEFVVRTCLCRLIVTTRFAALLGQQTLSARSTFAVGDSRLRSA